jgi:hypothetical protein
VQFRNLTVSTSPANEEAAEETIARIAIFNLLIFMV